MPAYLTTNNTKPPHLAIEANRTGLHMLKIMVEAVLAGNGPATGDFVDDAGNRHLVTLTEQQSRGDMLAAMIEGRPGAAEKVKAALTAEGIDPEAWARQQDAMLGRAAK